MEVVKDLLVNLTYLIKIIQYYFAFVKEAINVRLN